MSFTIFAYLFWNEYNLSNNVNNIIIGKRINNTKIGIKTNNINNNDITTDTVTVKQLNTVNTHVNNTTDPQS